MPDHEPPKQQRLKATTPLLVIASFVSLTEVVVGVALTQASGTVQLILTLFAVLFPVGVAVAFFLVLWNRPYVLYPPTEYGAATDVERYVGAMRPRGSTGSPSVPLA